MPHKYTDVFQRKLSFRPCPDHVYVLNPCGVQWLLNANNFENEVLKREPVRFTSKHGPQHLNPGPFCNPPLPVANSPSPCLHTKQPLLDLLMGDKVGPDADHEKDDNGEDEESRCSLAGSFV